MMSLIKIIEIENFQSHALTQLELNNGLNVIVGPSDQGKSAVIRALRWVCYNEPRGTEFFRVGFGNCRVRLELDSGEQIIRERTTSKNRYIYRDELGNERIFEGFGNNIPWEISKVLKMPKVSLDTDTEISLSIGQQLEGPFLLNESGTLRAKMIGRLTGVHIIDVAIRDVAKDLMTQQQEEKRLAGELKEIEEQLDKYHYLPDLLNCIKNGEKNLNHIVLLYQRRQSLLIAKEKWQSVCQDEKKYQDILTSLPPLDKLESLLVHAQLSSQSYQQLTRLNQQWKLIETEIGNTESLLEKTRGLEKGEKILLQAENSLRRRQELSQLQGKIQKWKMEYHQIKKFWDCLPAIEKGEEKIGVLSEKMEKLKKLSSSQDILSGLEKDISKVIEENKQLDKKLKTTLQTYQTKLKESGKCPLCFSSLDEDVLRKIMDNYGGGS